MKRGPPIRNGGPPPKRSAPSGPMSRSKCAGCVAEFIASYFTYLELQVPKWAMSISGLLVINESFLCVLQPPCQGIEIPMVHPLLAETP